MTVVVKVAGDADSVVSSAASLGISLRPMHPGTSDPELASWFVAEASDGEAVLDALRSLPDVDAAYLKPDEELPS